MTATNIRPTPVPGARPEYIPLLSNPAILRRDDGSYLMVYEESLPPPHQAHGDRRLYARTSPNGITFGPSMLLPFSDLDRSPPGTIFQSVPDLVALPDGSIRLYYVANGAAVASMRSTDGGLTWTQDIGYRLGTRPRPGGQAYVDPDVVLQADGTFLMYIAYSEFEPECGGLGCQRIRLARSTDGLSFVLDSNDLLKASPGSALFSLVDPDVYQAADGRWYMLYGEHGTAPPQLRVAIRTDSLVSGLQSTTVQPQEVAFRSGDLTLRGFIWKPEGTGPFPAVLWNHGSEKLPGWLPELAPLFLRHGYVLFIPHRSGQGRSPGEYILDKLERERTEKGVEAWSKLLVTLQEAHLNDQIAALSYLKALPYVSSSRIALAGCSFGGIQTVLAAQRNLGLRAAIDFAGAAQTWGASPDLRQRMLAAVRQATVPIFFIQAENDYDLTPSRRLSTEMQGAGKAYKLRIFSSFGSTAQEGHSFCIAGGDLWGQEVFSFLAAYAGP